MTASLALRRFVGHKHDTRFTWGEIAWHPRHWKAALEYCPAGMFSHNTLIVQLMIVGFYIHLPTARRGDGCMRDNEPVYGFYTIDNQIVWRWGAGYWSWSWPFFAFNHYSTEILTLDLNPFWIEYGTERGKWDERRAARDKAEAANCAKADFTYVLRSGEVQRRIATYHVDRMVWRRKWAPFLTMTRTCIWVEFDGEVGERSGSWKGGTTGCGYELKPGETPLACLRRMECERKFT
jgi:hypothetical protein